MQLARNPPDGLRSRMSKQCNASKRHSGVRALSSEEKRVDMHKRRAGVGVKVAAGGGCWRSRLAIRSTARQRREESRAQTCEDRGEPMPDVRQLRMAVVPPILDLAFSIAATSTVLMIEC